MIAPRKRSNPWTSSGLADDIAEHQAGHGVAVALGPGGEEPGEGPAVRGVQLAHQPQVQQGHLVIGGDEDVARVQVGVHEAVLEDHLQQRLQPHPGHALGVGPGAIHRQDLGPVDEASCTGCGWWTGPAITSGNTTSGLPRKFSRNRRLLCGFDPEIQLGEDGPPELLHHRRGLQRRRWWAPGPAARAPMRMTARSKVHSSTTSGPADLHRHHPPVGQAGLVHLRHRGRGDGDRDQFLEHLGEWSAQILLDGAGHGRERERTDVVLQPLQRPGHVFGHQVGPGAHDLPDLDEGGAQAAKQIGHHLRRTRFVADLARPCVSHSHSQPSHQRVTC